MHHQITNRKWIKDKFWGVLRNIYHLQIKLSVDWCDSHIRCELGRQQDRFYKKKKNNNHKIDFRFCPETLRKISLRMLLMNWKDWEVVLQTSQWRRKTVLHCSKPWFYLKQWSWKSIVLARYFPYGIRTALNLTDSKKASSSGDIVKNFYYSHKNQGIKALSDTPTISSLLFFVLSRIQWSSGHQFAFLLSVFLQKLWI